MIPASASEGHVINLPASYAPVGDWSNGPQEFSVVRVREQPGDPRWVYLTGVFTDDGPDAPWETLRVPATLEVQVLE